MGKGRRQPRARQRIVYHSEINETEHDSKEAALAEEGRKGYSEPVAVSLREGGDKDVSSRSCGGHTELSSGSCA